ADGPYRVTPNLMVVVPTTEHVSLHYGRTPVDWLAIVLTLLGLAGLVLLSRLAPVVMPEPRPRRPRRTAPEDEDVELSGWPALGRPGGQTDGPGGPRSTEPDGDGDLRPWQGPPAPLPDASRVNRSAQPDEG
ncbi:MAG: hypothetical protein WKF43_17810, partial [Acidimicrobiales bacterium]